ncbi:MULTISPECIES: homoserine kinase [Zunongwangia]|jgi:homoserine kinase|uniref:Homoserine kinase n=1 Tax=Zunongwangia profunda TaxID=398743 RepID=A0A3D5J0E6_9FLAO|nr:homoserine kinase [Zunongwangia profunda]MAG88603.1 homoserine kinase [Flavobacteriaceae bacterium]MAS72631.1 homoserine kinase [Zunongwangia sp.]MCC4227634.1 homoserine kinase [Zunongwangia profunda]HAJ82043.1 homoserine kinase [Zunongwangia profunda]HCV81599.1 homoserine kinase [Zunongwangia profunda]|tara:strand:- start:2210 stop:3130 length:921 start_codon:yes stop_codon:yes gene_type:complete
MEEIKVFAPATVANLSCGFDVLGCCLDNVGDEMIIKKNDLHKLRITKLEGQDLPLEVDQNVAGVAVKAMLEKLQSNEGFDIEIYKKIKAGSGIGSSAASSAGAVFAVNKLLGAPLKNIELIPFAMEGERLASGNAHADNVAPALLGGFTLVKSYEPLEVLSLPSPEELNVVILHPQIEVKTKDSRAIIKRNISLNKAVSQWGNLGALVSALYTNDYELLGRSLKDEIVEPIRSILIPYFDEIKTISLESGALGFGISGSGPSVYAMCRGEENAEKVKSSIAQFMEKQSITYDLHLSKINPEGVKIL